MLFTFWFLKKIFVHVLTRKHAHAAAHDARSFLILDASLPPLMPTHYGHQRTPRAVKVPGCGPWQRLTLEAGVRLIKSMRTFKQMPVLRSADPNVAAQQNDRAPTHKPIEPGFWGPKTELSSLGQRKIWERKFVTITEIHVSSY